MADVVLAGVHKAFGTTEVLHGIDLRVASGGSVGILGPSGCGKTTVLRLIAGFEAADLGSIAIGGQVVDAQVDHQTTWVPAYRRGVGYLPQEGALFPHLTVEGNIAFGLPKGSDRPRRVRELLELVALDPKLARRRPDELSGGQQQRVAVARALGAEPRVILLDEPFSGLDLGLRDELRKAVHALLRAAAVTTIVVTHDIEDVAGYADRVVLMHDGRIAPA